MDFGTTNSGIAVYDGHQIDVLKLDPVAETSVMRSVLYMTRDYDLHVGQAAIDLYNAQNTNRERRMVQKKVGRVKMSFGDGLNVETDVHVMVDDLEPGRLLRSLKSALATPYTGTRLFEREYTLEALIALYLKAARERACALLDTEVRQVVLGRPVHFVDAATDEDDAHAEARLRTAAQLAGFEEIAFELEPVAAARHYAQSVTHEQTILVYDFGGGTLDLTVMHIKPQQTPEILAIGGVGIAGDRFDKRIVEKALLPHFGEGVTWGDKKLPIPRDLLEHVKNWESQATAATLETRTFLRQLEAKCSAPARIYALESLIFNFYGFALFEAVEQTKRRLSAQHFDLFRFVGGEIDIWQMITRAQFESFAQTEWRYIREAILDTVTRSGLRPDQIDAVVRTGGSSSIPYGLDMLATLFGAEKLVTDDLFTGVTAGLGIIAYEAQA
jgi:hypothetical chaperone protein